MNEKRTLLVCCGTGCLASGAKDVLNALQKEAEGLDIELQPDFKCTGCNGLCQEGPIIRILPDDISYYKVNASDAAEIIKKTALKGELVHRLLYIGDDGAEIVSQHDHPFYKPQLKTVLRNVGQIDPHSIDDYIARDGYKGLMKSLKMRPTEILDEIETSGLRGRGGAGFPTAAKWKIAADQEVIPKYLVCNGDEGDPGAFMDGYTMEGDPHSVIEGMLIAAFAIGAGQGFLYIRDEYGLAITNIEAALKSARERGYLGDNILDTDFSFDLEIIRGGGAFVCGEETALLESIEGNVGEPRFKPPYPSVSGLWGCPTVTNNVETYANVPVILLKGGITFATIGTETSKGTKVFALVGKINRTGLVEIPMGTTLRQLIYDVGGGVKGGRPFKAVQSGGPSGGCLPASLLDVPVDYETLTAHGSMMGSGGMIIMDDRTCMVEIARYYVQFLAGESCGRCTPCREGLRQMLHILTNICAGEGRKTDIEELESIAVSMKEASICGLGKTAANPVLTTLRYFKDEYEAHIKEHHCPAGVCSKLTRFAVNKEKCIGCGSCAKICPVQAISGSLRNVHEIDETLCIGCGSCREVCKFDTIETFRRSEVQ